MKGFLLEAVGDEPRLVDVPEPVATDGQNVVKVLAAGVNPVDLLQAGDPARTVPRIVGNEAVVALDGNRAYAERTIAPHGSFAEQAVVIPSLAIPLPDDVADEAALAIGIAGIAAWMTLNRVAALRPGETALILGATGAVGRNAVQVARLLGAGRVVAAGRDTKRLTALRELGADATVALGDHDDAEALLEATAGGADVVLDVVYGAPLASALRATRHGARVVSAGRSAAQEVNLPFDALRGRTLLTHSNQLTDPAPKREAFLWLLDRLRAGELSVSTRVLPLADAAEAWALQRTSPGTKLVLRP
jgi:NADPH:quinone reductase-like Zn-dependent oxidoreductase